MSIIDNWTASRQKLASINPQPESTVNDTDSMFSQNELKSDLVFQSRQPTRGICLNPVNTNEMALVAQNVVREINIDKSVAYFHVISLNNLVTW